MPEDEPKGTFAKRLARLMKKYGYNQCSLARSLGHDGPGSVHRWVHAGSEPRYITLKRLKEALGCTYDELFED